MIQEAADKTGVMITKTLGIQKLTNGPRWFEHNCLLLTKSTQRSRYEFRQADNNAICYCRNKFLVMRTMYKNYCQAKKIKFMSSLS
jgi:hypothetical protein